MPLFLVDGHALAYRSYFAFAGRPLVNSKGEETSAIYGFINTLLALIEKYDPPYIAVAFDGIEKTFRHAKYDDYKANREKMPDTLISQLPVIFAVLDAMNIRHFVASGYEADDIIATLARRYEGATPIEIVSGDKDLFQLITDRVHVIRPGKGSVLEDELDPARLMEKTGLRPDQVLDYLALVGDSSDNIPGVRGIGEKTAKNLLGSFDSLDRIFENLDSITPPSVQRKLTEGHKDALMSRELIVLRYDVRVDVDLEDMARRDHRTPEFRSFLVDLEFNRMLEQVFDRPARGTPPPREQPHRPAPARPPRDNVDVSYELVDSESSLERICATLGALDEFAVDVETSGLDPMRAELAGVSLAVAPGRAYYIPVSSQIGADDLSLLPPENSPGLALEIVRRHLGPVLSAEKPSKVGQNIKYDEIVLARAGMPVAGITFDTMLASYCLDPARRSHGLDALALELCSHTMIPFASLFATRTRNKDIRTVPLKQVTTYACEDADYTLRLKQTFAPLLEASVAKSLFSEVEMPLRGVLARMEMAGVRVDTDFLDRLSTRYGEQISSLEEKIYAAVGEPFNINSTQKLREVLFVKLGLKTARKTKTGYSTDVDVLTGLADQHPVIGLLLGYRQLVKLKNTYIDALPRLVNPGTGRVHTSYNQAVATTGRLSSSDPNLQNIPIRTADGREIRKAFIPGDDNRVLLDADYSQIELRILAHLSKDDELMQAFRDDADVHRRTAAKMLKIAPQDVTDDLRGRAKTVNFGIIYGMGARGLSQSLDIDVGEARQFIDDYFRSYPGVKRFIDETIDTARKDMSIGTMLGRVRRLPDINSADARSRAFSERIAVNTPVQGAAADIIKMAMLRADAEISRRGLRSRMILQVHDELLFDVPVEELDEMKALVRDCMETAIQLEVPLKVDMGTGDNWLEAH